MKAHKNIKTEEFMKSTIPSVYFFYENGKYVVESQLSMERFYVSQSTFLRNVETLPSLIRDNSQVVYYKEVTA